MYSLSLWFTGPLTLDIIPLLLYLPSVFSSQVLCTVVVFCFLQHGYFSTSLAGLSAGLADSLECSSCKFSCGLAKYSEPVWWALTTWLQLALALGAWQAMHLHSWTAEIKDNCVIWLKKNKTYFFLIAFLNFISHFINILFPRKLQ